MAPHMPNKPIRRRRRVARWAVLLVGLVLIGTGMVTYRHYADPERVRAEVEALLQQFAHGRVRVGAARFSLLDGIRLLDVSVASVRAWSGRPFGARRSRWRPSSQRWYRGRRVTKPSRAIGVG